MKNENLLSPICAAWLIAVGCCSCAGNSGADKAQQVPPSDNDISEKSSTAQVFWQGNDLVKRSGEWKWVVTFLQKGTRSEGQHGVLQRKGEEVSASETPLETPFGVLQHYGDTRQRPWDVTGWNLANKKDIPHSGQIKLKRIPEPQRAALTSDQIQFPIEGGKEAVHLPVGRTFTVRLKTRTGTGYLWELSKNFDAGIISLDTDPVENTEDKKLLGGPGETQFAFQTVKLGKTLVEFVYRRPWEKEKDPEYRAIVEVTVGELTGHPPPAEGKETP